MTLLQRYDHRPRINRQGGELMKAAKWLSIGAVCIVLMGCVGPAHDSAEALAPTLPGYHQYNACEPWARAFKASMEAQGHPVTLVGFTWSMRGETVNHLVAAWKDKDGWWMQDNISGPRQVDSFDQYTWERRVENFVEPMGPGGSAVMPNGVQVSQTKLLTDG